MFTVDDVSTLRDFQTRYLLKTLSGDGDPQPDHQMASNAIDRLIQRVELLQLQLQRGAKCWLYEDANKSPVFSIDEPPYDAKWKGQTAVPLFVQEVGIGGPRVVAWMYLENDKECFTMDPAVRDMKTYRSIPPVPLHQNRYA
jgi:hypothetical protein